MEAGEPHLFGASIAAHLAAGPVDRVLGSLHSLTDGDRLVGVSRMLTRSGADATMRRYLTEMARMVRDSDVFEVLAHVDDFPRRYWPAGATGTPSGPSRPSTARCSGRWRRPGGRWRSTPPARWPRWSWCAGSATRAARR